MAFLHLQKVKHLNKDDTCEKLEYILNKIVPLEFDSWWYHEGSQMSKLPSEDEEIYVRRMLKIGWLTGACKLIEHYKDGK